MTVLGHHGPVTQEAQAALGALVEAVLTDPALWDGLKRLVDQRLAQGAGTEPEWVSRARAARLAGASVSTIRDWQAAGKLSRGHRGRVNLAQLREHLSAGPRRSAAKPDHTAPVADLKAARAAAEIRAALRSNPTRRETP